MRVKNKFYIILLLFCLLSVNLSVNAEVIRLNPDEKNELKLTDKPDNLNKNLVIQDKDVVEDLIKCKRKKKLRILSFFGRLRLTIIH